MSQGVLPPSAAAAAARKAGQDGAAQQQREPERERLHRGEGELTTRPALGEPSAPGALPAAPVLGSEQAARAEATRHQRGGLGVAAAGAAPAREAEVAPRVAGDLWAGRRGFAFTRPALPRAPRASWLKR